MRALVGPTDEAAFDNPSGGPVFADLPVETSETVFDLGCGCGRLARQFLQQEPRPKKYIGVDLHAGMIQWDQANLGAVDSNFTFVHHDVFELGFNPSGKRLDQSQRLPAPDGFASLAIAYSVFTHLLEDEIGYYLKEIARILRPDGLLRSTWFLFDKQYFPMMQDFQNTLYINTINPTNAVIVDREWLIGQLIAAGLTVASTSPPLYRGYQWTLDLKLAQNGEVPVLPLTDDSPFGSLPPPLSGVDAHLIGRDS